MLDEALAYASFGWRVCPIKAKDKKPPLVKEWQNKATTDPTIIHEWLTKWADANIGIATGRETGWFVLDIDGGRGSESLIALEAEIGPLPETREARTGSGGRHLLFKMPERDIRNQQGFRPGLDIRGDGGYIVAPPSIHPNGQAYSWPYNFDDEIAEAPEEFLDVICPQGMDRNVSGDIANLVESVEPEAPVLDVEASVPIAPPVRPQSTSIIDRASLYLQECEPATQGQAGHDKLLWAARALVVGFELSMVDALSLLWLEFNPRCNPSWDRSKHSEVKDFERKVEEVMRTPGKKPRGWLIDELGLRTDEEAMDAYGEAIRQGLLGNTVTPPPITASTIVPEPEEATFEPFPMECFPPQIAEYGYRVAEANGVDLSFTGLPMLVVAATAMGNAFRIRLKDQFDIPPTLWGGIVAATGQNKTAPLRVITAPLRLSADMEDLGDDALLNPQGRMIVSDATTEAIVFRLGGSPRGLCANRNELARWVKSFDAYKKGGGGDEQIWLEFWDAQEYQLDRKTNAEEVFIPAASVCVLGGIQPKVLIECFDPGKFASGLVERILIARPPRRKAKWTDVEISDEIQSGWVESIMWLRTRPFAGLDPQSQAYIPNILIPSPTGKARYIEFFDALCEQIEKMDELSQAFASKARVIGARLALCIHGLTHAVGKTEILSNVSLRSIEAGCALAHWFLNEQVRVYGLASQEFHQHETAFLMNKIKREHSGSIEVRDLMRTNNRKYKSKADAWGVLNRLVKLGLGVWNDDIFKVNP